LPLRGDYLPKVKIFDILRPHSHPPAPIQVKFCTAKRTLQVPVSHAKFDMNRCNESPLQGEKPDFWPVSKFNTGSLPLLGNPAGNELFCHSVHFISIIIINLFIPFT